MRLVFAGTPEFAARALAALLRAGHEVALVLTQPDRASGRGMKLAASPVKRLARAHGLDLYQPESLKSEASVARIAAARPDALVVAAYGLILPQAVLDLAPRRALNIHASLLPRWRGAAPIQRALLAGDAQTGISIMRMDAGLDTGPLLAQRAVAIAPEDDAGTLHDRLAVLGAQTIVDVLAAEPATAVPQPAQGISYAPKIEKSETVIAWIRPATELERAVRAFRPVPGASTSVGGVKLKIWRARVAANRGSPGELLGAGPAGLAIACGEGALEVSELQRAGGKRLGAAEFLRGAKLSPGARFGA